MRIRSKLWIETADGEILLGGGLLKIFKLIERHGSMSAAAKELGMSYRALWGKVRTLEERLGVQLVERAAQGARRRGAHLTEQGKQLVALFEQFETQIETHIENASSQFIEKLTHAGFRPNS